MELISRLKGSLSDRSKNHWNTLKKYKKFITDLGQQEDLTWTFSVMTERLKYKFSALRNGILLNRDSQANLYNFRRNIHRIEKGLSYAQVKDTFAEDYILETVLYLKEDNLKNIFDRNTRIWGESVLNLYFQTCKQTAVISKAYELYQSMQLPDHQSNWVPYRSDTRPALSVSYADLHQLALRRRSVRFYLDKEIEVALIEQAVAIAALSPSACNRQSFKYLFFNQANVVRSLAQIPGGVTGYEIPNVVVVVGNYRGYFDERDINAPIIDSSLSVMAFLFALETLGLSSVCINWPNLPDREEKIRKLIHLEKDEFVVMLIGVGYPHPEGKIPYSAKRSTDQLLFVNQRLKDRSQFLISNSASVSHRFI